MSKDDNAADDHVDRRVSKTEMPIVGEDKWEQDYDDESPEMFARHARNEAARRRKIMGWLLIVGFVAYFLI